MARAFPHYAIFGTWYVVARLDTSSANGAGGGGRLHLPEVRAICDG
jgi:hypothetical protein